MTRQEIKKHRLALKLSQAELARQTHLTASEISRIECGYRELSEAEHAAIVAVLGGTTEPVGKGLAKSKTPEPPAPPVQENLPAATVAATPKAAAPVPTGTDLSDPTTFGVLPDQSLLQPLKAGESDFRARLAAEVAKATTILHTPRVPAAVWREWRQFEKQASDILRAGVTAAAAVVPPPAPAVVRPAPVAAPVTTPESEAKSESKSFNSLFVESARNLLPAETLARLNKEAEAALAADSSMGFMKHFRRLAESSLAPDAIKKISEEAEKLLGSAGRQRSRRGRKPVSVAV